MAVFIVVLMTLGYMSLESGMRFSVEISRADQDTFDREEFTGDSVVPYALQRFHDEPDEVRDQRARQLGSILAMPFLFVLWIVVTLYLLGALYGDRKDRSILFWKSMPVSDLDTVIAKLLTALICVPAVYVATMATVHLLALVGATLAAIVHGIPIVALLDTSSEMVSLWFNVVLYLAFVSLWCLPFYGWLLLVSAFAKGTPAAWALGVPLAIVATEMVLTGNDTVGIWIGNHVVPIRAFRDELMGMSTMWDRLLSVDLVLALALGSLFVFGAVWFRRGADEL